MKLEPGTQVKHYELQEKIGVGSSGEIWKASNNGQTVAIKFMHGKLLESKSSDKHRERLEREVNALKILQHPNIPALYDYDLQYERPYIVMEFIESPSLDRMLIQGELVQQSISKRLNVIKSVASALSLAHQHNIIHRDIKPGNINGIDKPYLMDFSIALAAENSAETNFNIGTSIYMPPDFDAPDALGDCWSFAVVSFEILFGRHPIFNYDDPTIKKGMYARFEAKKRLDGGTWFKPGTLPAEQIPADMKQADLARLDAIFTKALGEREERYTDLPQFARDLEAAIFVSKNTAALADAEAQKPAAQPVVEQADSAPAGGLSPRMMMIAAAVIGLVIVVAVIFAVVSSSGG